MDNDFIPWKAGLRCYMSADTPEAFSWTANYLSEEERQRLIRANPELAKIPVYKRGADGKIVCEYPEILRG